MPMPFLVPFGHFNNSTDSCSSMINEVKCCYCYYILFFLCHTYTYRLSFLSWHAFSIFLKQLKTFHKAFSVHDCFLFYATIQDIVNSCFVTEENAFSAWWDDTNNTDFSAITSTHSSIIKTTTLFLCFFNQFILPLFFLIKNASNDLDLNVII